MKSLTDRRRRGRTFQLEGLEDRSLLATVGASPTVAANEVAYLYQTLLLRSPAAADATFWDGVVEKGVASSVVYNAFVNSTEHQALVTAGTYTGTPLSTTDVSAFNKTFAADIAKVNAISIVSGSVLGASANVTTYVDALYTTLLTRSADTAGQTFWVGKIKGGTSLDSVVEGFLNSTEYAGLVTAGTATYTLPSLTSGDTSGATTFVDSLYTGVLQRAADTPGETTWVDKLTAGASSNTIITAFLTSTEYTTGLLAGTITP